MLREKVPTGKMNSIFVIFFLFLTLVGSEVTFEFGREEMQKICSIPYPGSIISEKCAAQLNESCNNPNVLFDITDASSKFPYPGIAVSSRADLGNFEQCISIDHKYSEGRILGKYCYPGLLLPDFSNLNSTDIDSIYKLSICMPDACSAADYTAIFGKTLVFIDYNCVTKENNKKIEAIDIATFVILVLTLALIVASTTYDVYLHKTEEKSRHPLMLAFSIYSNTTKILKTSEGTKEQIQVFHGMKIISMFWVIAGHGFVAWKSLPVLNSNDVVRTNKELYFFYMKAAPLAVDTFFYIGGFLLAYQYMKQKSKPLIAQLQAVPQMIIHRYLRLTPAVLMLYLIHLSVLPRIGSGPLWEAGIKQGADLCHNQPAWSFFLYLQNYLSYPDEPCLVHTWYLSADMQMFVLSPLVIIPVAIMLQDSKNFGRCMLCLLSLNLVLTALPLVVKLVYRDYNNNYDTHSRLVDYFIGVMVGVFMREQQYKPFILNKLKHTSMVNLLIWIIILLGMLATTICYQEVETNEGYESTMVFYSLMRPAWCIGLSWIVYSSYHGYGGIVSWFLSRPIFQILGKLSYCMYVVHGFVLVYCVLGTRTKLYFSNQAEFMLWCAYVVMSVILAFFWTLAFESPLMIIEKFIMGLGRPKGKTLERA